MNDERMRIAERRALTDPLDKGSQQEFRFMKQASSCCCLKEPYRFFIQERETAERVKKSRWADGLREPFSYLARSVARDWADISGWKPNRWRTSPPIAERATLLEGAMKYGLVIEGVHILGPEETLKVIYETETPYDKLRKAKKKIPKDHCKRCGLKRYHRS